MKRAKRIIHYYCDEIVNKKWLGNDIVVAVMDTGAAPHPELSGCFLIFKDFVNGYQNMYDDNGHGTHVSGIIAGKNIGIAPRSKLIPLKVLDQAGHGKVEHSMRGFRWILENQEKYNIRIVNISMGMSCGMEEREARQILGAVELLWDMGIVVVASAGNRGPKPGTITVPGVQEKIITVGSADMKNSGRGVYGTSVLKPDLVAPGAHILSCSHEWERGKYLADKSGTSMAAPIVSGAIACLLSKNRDLPNHQIKKILAKSCVSLGLEPVWQGNGLIHVKKLLCQEKILDTSANIV